MQLNTSDIHAGEIYMLEDDPGEDHNVYKLISDKMLAQLANLTDVSGVWQKRPIFLLCINLCFLSDCKSAAADETTDPLHQSWDEDERNSVTIDGTKGQEHYKG